MREHAGVVTAIDLDVPCRCGGPTMAVTQYRIPEGEQHDESV
jgi:hypothetical protein